MKKRNSLKLIAWFCLLASLFLLAACSRSHDNSENQQILFSAKLVTPADSTDLEKRVKAELVRRYERQYDACVYSGGWAGGTVPVPASTESGGATGASTDSSIPHSGTNNQEIGVDEGDLVKTDGTYIYLVRGSHFMILKAYPADQTAIISDIDMKEPISELHLSAGRAAVISNSFVPYPMVMAASTSMPVMQGNPSIHVYLYDVTAPASPVLATRYELPGVMQGSRRIDGRLYLVTNYSVNLASPAMAWDYLPSGSWDQDSYKTACSQALAENLKTIEALTIQDLLPVYTRTPYTAGVAGSPSTGPAVAYADVFMPEYGNGTDLSLVTSLDMSGQDPAIASSALFSSWSRIYMTTDSLYLASDDAWLWIEPMSGADMPQYNPEPRTAVHKFGINASGKPMYRASTVVDGWLNNRFSMSDYQGYLRIGTTRGGWWGENISNQLAILAEAEGDDTLMETGKLSGIAYGERIFSMRFDRDRAYMVTYRLTDPLFTLDLSDPQNPRIAGEIQVLGFSTYMHILGQDKSRLLTIGPEADETGRLTGGNKLQLFDVADINGPKLLAKYELGQGWSDAVYDPHAFFYYEPLKLLAIPYYSYTYTPGTYTTVDGGTVYAGDTYTYTSGLDIFNIDSASISLRGIISAPTITNGYGTNYQDTVDRAVIIGDDINAGIYSIAHRSVTVAGADQLDVKKVVQLPESYSYIYTMVGGGTATTAATRMKTSSTNTGAGLPK